MSVEKIQKQIVDLCGFCANYKKFIRSIRSSSLDGKHYLAIAKSLSLQLAKHFSNEIEGYEVIYSRGMSIIPRVPWVAIVPKGRRISNGPSVAICFGKTGEGVVAGLMNGKRIPIGDLHPIIRTASIIRVDVNGSKPETSYNNNFINPLELVLQEDFEVQKLLSHILESLRLLKTIA